MDSRNAVKVTFAVKVDVVRPQPTSMARSSMNKSDGTSHPSSKEKDSHQKPPQAPKNVQFSNGNNNALNQTSSERLMPHVQFATTAQRTKTRLTREGVPVFGCPVSAARLGRRPASASNIKIARPEQRQPENFYIPTGDLVNRDYNLIDIDLKVQQHRKAEWSKTEQPQMCRKESERPEYLHSFRPKEDRTTYFRPFTTSGAVLRPTQQAATAVHPWQKATRDDDVDLRAVPHTNIDHSRETFVKTQAPRYPYPIHHL